MSRIFSSPWWLLLLLAVVVLAVTYFYVQRLRRKRAFTFANLEVLDQGPMDNYELARMRRIGDQLHRRRR